MITNQQQQEEEVVVIDKEVFSQVLEMDEEDGEFCKSLISTFKEQAEQAFNDMDILLKAGDLTGLSKRAHFLKGSAAALGIRKLRYTCEKIQYAGEKRYVQDDNIVFEMVRKLLSQAVVEYKEALCQFHSVYNIVV